MRPDNKDRGVFEEDPVVGTTIELSLPLGDGDLFRHGASEPILSFLALSPDTRIPVRTLADLVGYSEKATRSAVDALEAAGLIETERAENKRLVSISRERLHRPDDPILSIPQTTYHFPTRLALHLIREKLEDVKGVILFGSVARGNADRRSDIDLWVLAGGDRPAQIDSANKTIKKLEGTPIPPKLSVYRRNLDEIDTDTFDDLFEQAHELDSEKASGQRYSYEILVETPETALRKRDSISDELFLEGITLQDSDTLQRVKMEVLEA